MSKLSTGKNHVLKAKDKFAAMKWLEAHKDDALGTTDDTLAKHIHAETGISIVASNVGSLRRALGIAKLQRGAGIHNKKTSNTAKDIRFGLVAKTLNHLYEKLGENSPYLVALNELTKREQRKVNGTA